MSQLIRPDDPRLTWQGAISLQHTEEWVMPWRIPYETCNLFAPDALQERAAMPALLSTAIQIWLPVSWSHPQKQQNSISAATVTSLIPLELLGAIDSGLKDYQPGTS